MATIRQGMDSMEVIATSQLKEKLNSSSRKVHTWQFGNFSSEIISINFKTP